MAKKKKTKKIRHPIKKKKKRPKARPKIVVEKKKVAKKSHALNRVSKSIPEETVHKTRVRVISVGGGGGSILSEIASHIKRADFVAANTDSRALKELGKAVKNFNFGQTITRGLGTGMNSSLGEAAAQNDKEKIKKLFEGQDLCIIIACLGGGTSSGAGPVFAKAAREAKTFTYGIFTLPFEFEGEKKMATANESLQKIKPYLNAYSVIPNERIFQIIDKNSPLKSALSAINKRLAENLEGLLEMIYLPGLINIDFADLRTILDGRGKLTYLNTIEIEGPGREEGIKKIIYSPLYPYSIKGARGVLYDITGGKDLQLAEVSYISKIISESVNKAAKIIFGIGQDKKYQNKIKITLLATGCGIKTLQKPPRIPMVPPKVKVIQPKVKPLTPASENKAQAPQKAKKEKPRKRTKPKKNMARPSKTISKEKEPLKTETNLQQPLLKPKPEEKKEEVKIRRSALELKKVIEEEEKKILEQEKTWDHPAIFRKKQINSN